MERKVIKMKSKAKIIIFITYRVFSDLNLIQNS